MEYKRLIELDNQYPNLRNYKKGTADNTGVLYGLYPEKNKIEFTFPTIDNLKWVSGTDFKFILVIRNTITDTNPKLYTSEAYYNDLVASINETNPYFSAASFNPAYVVNITISELLTTYTDLQKLEKKDAVLMNRNIFINADDTMDYDSLITYIDWVVSKVDPLDTDNGGVIQETVLSNWNYYSIDPVTQIVTNKILDVPTSQTADSAAYAQAQLNAANVGQNVSLKNSKQSELNDLLTQITNLESEIKTKEHYIYNKKFFGVAFTGSVTVNNFTFNASLGWKEGVTKSLTDQLTTKLNDLKAKQVTLQSEINSLSTTTPITQTSVSTPSADGGGNNTSNIGNTIGQAQSAISNINNTIGQAAAGIAAAQGIANAVTSLVGKIPKSLPKNLPQLPKLPNSIGDLVPKVSLPSVPKLPKMPEVPKIPSLKLPPVPKFKPKVPKVPKKFKKGLAGLKDAANAAQGAVAGAQGALAGAVASAKGAVASAQNSATSAVASAKSAATSAVSQAQSSVNSAVTSAQSKVADIQTDIISQKNAQIQSGKRTAKTQKDGTIRYIYNDPSSPTGYVYGDGTIVNKDD